MDLCVEDNPDDFYLLKRAFLKNDIRNPIHWVQDGLEAIKYLEGGLYTHLLAAVEHVMHKKEEQQQ